MNSKDRIELFLKYQSENMSFEDISKKLEVKPTTLRRSLNKYGYKSNNGIYEKSTDESQISFEDIKNSSKSVKSNAKGNNKIKIKVKKVKSRQRKKELKRKPLNLKKIEKLI